MSSLNEIRSRVREAYEKGTNTVIVFGRYSTDISQTKGRADGFLLLTGIWIYDPTISPHTKKVYSLDGGVSGGVCGCFIPPKIKKI